MGEKDRSLSLSDAELTQLNKTLQQHRTQRKNSRNYHFALKDSSAHPLSIPDICRQVKDRLPELTIVRLGAGSGNGTLLMISEGVLVALIEGFLDLIDHYQRASP